MQDFQQRKKIRKVLYSRSTVIVLAIITIFLVKGAVGVVLKDMESKKNVDLAKESLETAKSRSEALSKNITSLNTQAGVESEIRQRFNVSKEGEQVAVIVDRQTATSSDQSTSQGFWASIEAWFRGLFGR
jgi:hypothetical protein